jgi:hypothetical protein
MNRRDALKFIGPAALINGTAIVDAERPPDSRLSWGPQPHYYVLYVYVRGVNDFVAVGVYTKRADAEAHELAAKAQLGVYPKQGDAEPTAKTPRFCGAIIERSHEELCYELADHRIGALADHLRRLMNKSVVNDDQRTRPVFATLYGKDTFSMAIKILDTKELRAMAEDAHDYGFNQPTVAISQADLLAIADELDRLRALA